jgi:hypothetical protein
LADAAPAAPAPDAGPAFPDEGERRAIFVRLVEAVRAYHVFSANTRQNLGRRWEDDLPELEKAFASAADDATLRDVLGRFSASLHDGHLSYSPPERAGRGDHLTLGVTLDAEWVDGKPRYYVAALDARVAHAAPELRVGDLVVSAAGAPGDALARTHALRSNENNWRGIASDVGRYLTSRSTARSATSAGTEEAWVFRHRAPRAGGGASDVTVRLTWQKEAWAGEGEDGEPSEESVTDIDYAPHHCSLDLPDRAYPASYRLKSHGRFYCLYASDKAPYDAYPIVRHYSVYYQPLGNFTVAPRFLLPNTEWQVSAEYYALSAQLRALPRVRGVILDLRDNLGGNDPEWFLDWYAPAPYTDFFTNVRLYAEYADPAFRKRVDNVGDDWYRWYQRASAGMETGAEVRRPFKCQNAECAGDNRFTPAHGLVSVPMALLVGPGCMSSCAHITQVFDENDFGPLIGEPTAASYTSQRFAYPVVTKAGLDLGTIRLGLSSDTSGKSGAPLEGATVHIDYPVERTFEGRDQWDAALVDAAVRAFREFRFPKRVAKLGP